MAKTIIITEGYVGDKFCRFVSPIREHHQPIADTLRKMGYELLYVGKELHL